MKKLQKIFALFLCGTLCTGLVSGCGTRKSNTHTGLPKETKAAEATIAPASDGMVINCWGDSLTAGTAYENKLSYPAALQNALTDYKVNNFGIGGESSKTIAQRMGASPLMVGVTTEKKETFTLPADTSQSEPFNILGDDSSEAGILKQIQEDTQQDCFNPVMVNGMECVLSRQGMFYCLSRTDSGEEVSIKSGDQIIPQASFGNYSNDINIIWAGTNDRTKPETVSKTITNIETMIEYLNSDRYIVIGLTALSYMPEVAKVNEILAETFGDHFYDFRSYILENGLQDAGIKATKQDKQDIKIGEIPSSFMNAPDPATDHVHGNEAFYQLLANELVKKLQELHYIENE
ncbi:MAG: hypothetical protein K2J67_13005 [Lachnospiraceae bacterium]|nr:hypothetical protein [Lachnospiraceae bacterium]